MISIYQDKLTRSALLKILKLLGEDDTALISYDTPIKIEITDDRVLVTYTKCAVVSRHDVLDVLSSYVGAHSIQVDNSVSSVCQAEPFDYVLHNLSTGENSTATGQIFQRDYMPVAVDKGEE